MTIDPGTNPDGRTNKPKPLQKLSVTQAGGRHKSTDIKQGKETRTSTEVGRLHHVFVTEMLFGELIIGNV